MSNQQHTSPNLIKKIVVTTPLGKTRVGRGTTQISGVTVSVEEIKKGFEEIAGKGIIPEETFDEKNNFEVLQG